MTYMSDILYLSTNFVIQMIKHYRKPVFLDIEEIKTPILNLKLFNTF